MYTTYKLLRWFFSVPKISNICKKPPKQLSIFIYVSYIKLFLVVPKTSNITKTVGLTGTKVSSLRGRGKITMVRARTGRKQFKRRLGRRRRTGQWIKRAQAN